MAIPSWKGRPTCARSEYDEVGPSHGGWEGCQVSLSESVFLARVARGALTASSPRAMRR